MPQSTGPSAIIDPSAELLLRLKGTAATVASATAATASLSSSPTLDESLANVSNTVLAQQMQVDSGFASGTSEDGELSAMTADMVARTQAVAAKLAASADAALLSSQLAQGAADTAFSDVQEAVAAEVADFRLYAHEAGVDNSAIACLLSDTACSLCQWRSRGAVDVRFTLQGPPPPPPPHPPPPRSASAASRGGGGAAPPPSSSSSTPRGLRRSLLASSQSSSQVLGGGYRVVDTFSDYSVLAPPAGRSLLNKNTILGGMLLFQTRVPPPPASSAATAATARADSSAFTAGGPTPAPFFCGTRFAFLASWCRGVGGLLDSAPFGRDPVFVPSSPLFQPSINISAYYNTTEGSGDISPNGGVPFGFFARPTRGKPVGYPVFIDNEATPGRAEEIMRFLHDGSFIDERTLALSVELIAYNAALLSVYYVRVDLTFLPSSVVVSADSMAVPVVEYDDPRMRRWVGVNVALTLLAAAQLAREGRRVWRWARDGSRWRRKGRYQRAMRLAVFAHVLLQIAAMGLFWGEVLVSALTFDPAQTFPVYDDLQAEVRPLRKRPGGGPCFGLFRKAMGGLVSPQTD